MAILKSKALILTLFLFSTLTFAIRSPLPEASATDEMTQLLSDNGLPPGLFPDSVNKVQAENDGRMTVNLPDDCYVRSPRGLHFHYQPTIMGVIEHGAINQLIGVEMEWPAGWFSVIAMTYRAENDNMVFDCGKMRPKVAAPMTDFASVPTCLPLRNDWTSKIRSVADAEV